MGECFGVSEMFWYQKFLDNRGTTILSFFFVSHRQESSRANPSVFQNYSCFKIFWIIGVSRFCRLFLFHSAEKFVENPLMIQKIQGTQKKFMQKRGVSRFSVENV